MKKVLIITLFLSIFLMTTKQEVFANESNKTVISAQDNAILALVNETVDLSNYIYQHNASTMVSMNDVKLTSYSDDLILDGLNITVKAKGAHAFLLQYQTANIYVYIITKEVNDDHYVLYSEDFTGLPNGKLPRGYSVVSGSAGIENEMLTVNGKGGSAIVTLPNYLRKFMNYIVEADFTIYDQDNSSRWASLMFRYSTENYYQMAVRKDATTANGVEFAKRINGQWNVTNTYQFTEEIQANKMYKLKIDVLDSIIKEYLNDELVITHEQALEYKRGLIGVQASGSNAYFDNFKVILPVDYLRTETHEFTQIPNVYEVETGIVNPPSLITPIESLEQIRSYKDNKRPQTGMLTLNSDLDVVNKDNQKIDTLYNVLVEMDNLIIPLLKLNDESKIEVLSEKLKLWGILDAFLMSENKKTILDAREVYPLIRGVLDYSNKNEELNNETLFKYRQDTNESESIIVVLNEALVNKKVVNYLQQRLVTVWTKSSVDTDENKYKALLSGVNGIMTPHPLAFINIYESITKTTHIREVFLIAHRGLHNGYTASKGPENTIEASMAALVHGAKIIEIDVHLTYDEEVVVIHDDTTNRTANYNFSVSGSLLGTLESILLKDISNQGKEFRIPSYINFLKAFKDKDVVLFVEIKPTNKKLIEKTRDITVELGMEDKVVFIMFAAQNANDLKEVMPSMSRGYLTGALASSNVTQSVLSVLTAVVPMKTTFNPSYSPITTELVKALNHRGISVWPWTIDEVNTMNYHYNSGVGGITTNNLDNYLDSYIKLSYENQKFDIDFNNYDSFRVQGFLKTLNDKPYQYRTNLEIIKNTAGAAFDQSGLLTKVDSLGNVGFYTKALTTLPNGIEIEIMSDYMELNVIDDTNETSNTALMIIVGSGIAFVLGLTVWLVLKRK